MQLGHWNLVEECARIADQVDALLSAEGETGKKLDFLLQEMNRETNTILSKTSGAGEAGLRITELAIAAKSAIEKIREQSLNLECRAPNDLSSSRGLHHLGALRFG